MNKTYPHTFLGRCQTCLDNAYLSSTPCQVGYGIGKPLFDEDCAIRYARKKFDADYIKSDVKPTGKLPD